MVCLALTFLHFLGRKARCGARPPPPAAFGLDALKKVAVTIFATDTCSQQQVRALAGTRPKKVLAKAKEEESPRTYVVFVTSWPCIGIQEDPVLTREEFRRGLLASQTAAEG